MPDLGLYGVETFRSRAVRFQTPLNLLMDRRLFGSYGRVTDSHHKAISMLRSDFNSGLGVEPMEEFGDRSTIQRLNLQGYSLSSRAGTE